MRHDKRKVVFVDLDSTLCDTRQRWSMLAEDPGQTDWVAYSLACADDAPIEGTVALVKMLFAHYTIVILSGRMKQADAATRKWLSDHGVPYDMILLRADEDEYIPNGEWKSQQITQFKEFFNSAEIALLIDDWPEVKEVIERDHGIPVLMVNPLYRLEEYMSEAEAVENRDGVAWTRTLR